MRTRQRAINRFTWRKEDIAPISRTYITRDGRRRTLRKAFQPRQPAEPESA